MSKVSAEVALARGWIHQYSSPDVDKYEAEIKAEAKAELRNELKEELKAELRHEVNTGAMAGLLDEIKGELEAEFGYELEISVRPKHARMPARNRPVKDVSQQAAADDESSKARSEAVRSPGLHATGREDYM